MSTNTDIKVEPYLFFDGRCEEAIEFYKKALGAEVVMCMRYDQSPQPAPPGMVKPGSEKKIMYSNLKIGDSFVMAADHCGQGEKPKFDGFSLSLRAPDEATAKKMFNALTEGGAVRMPLTKTFFSPCFGMLEDKFGVGWMVIVHQQPA